MPTTQDRIDACNRALEAVRGVIPADLYGEVNDYVNRFNEWGLGMENLIDQISEFDIRITSAQFEAIRSAMALMGLAECGRLAYLQDHNLLDDSCG